MEPDEILDGDELAEVYDRPDVDPNLAAALAAIAARKANGAALPHSARVVIGEAHPRAVHHRLMLDGAAKRTLFEAALTELAPALNAIAENRPGAAEAAIDIIARQATARVEHLVACPSCFRTKEVREREAEEAKSNAIAARRWQALIEAVAAAPDGTLRISGKRRRGRGRAGDINIDEIGD